MSGAPYATRPAFLTSSGAASSGGIPLLNSLGVLDSSFLPATGGYRAGLDTAPIPSIGSRFQTSKAVLYAIPFPTGVIPVVTITPRNGPFAGGNGVSGFGVDFWIASGSESETGFTVIFNSNHGETNSDGDINTPVDFGYIAMAP